MPNPDIGRKSQFLPQSGGPHQNTVITFGMEKLEWYGYPMVKNIFWIRLFVSTEYTKHMMDRQTMHDSIGCTYS